MATLKSGGVVVRNAFSLISAGSEQTSVELARKNLSDNAKFCLDGRK